MTYHRARIVTWLQFIALTLAANGLVLAALLWLNHLMRES